MGNIQKWIFGIKHFFNSFQMLFEKFVIHKN